MILVTGSTGYVGRRVVKLLTEEGKRVRCMVRATSDTSIFQELDVETVQGEVTDLASLKAAVEEVDSVVHLVAIIREKGPLTFEAVNHQGTRNVIAAAQGAGVKRLILLSAIGAQPNPKYPYLNSKWQGEQAVVGSGIPHVILRPSIIFGRGDEFINALAAAVRWGLIAPIIGSGKTKFQPILVEDVARCISLALKDQNLTGRVVEIGGPQQLSYNEVINVILRTYRLKRLKVHLPLFLMKLTAPVVGMLAPYPPVTPSQLDMLDIDNVAELDAVEKHFHFNPSPLEGNIDYILDLGKKDALAISLGLKPARRW